MTKLQDLIDLAKEPSSEKRRVLLREVTDLFFANPDRRGGELTLFDDVLTQLAGEMEEAVRVELAVRLAPTPSPPFKLVRTLAADEAIAVAQPILEGSPALTDEDLVAVAMKRGQAHLKAISRRPIISVAVSDVIVERGDDETLGVLLHNDGAQLSRQAHEAAVDRAGANPDLQEAVVNRRDLPVDLRNGRCYLPAKELSAAGLAAGDLLEPGNEPKFRPFYARYLALTEAHLTAGWAYTNALPGRCIRVRLACAWPILIGMKTLAMLRAGNVLDPGQRIKVSRPEVNRLILRSVLYYPWPGAWRRLVSAPGSGA